MKFPLCRHVINTNDCVCQKYRWCRGQVTQLRKGQGVHFYFWKVNRSLPEVQTHWGDPDTLLINQKGSIVSQSKNTIYHATDNKSMCLCACVSQEQWSQGCRRSRGLGSAGRSGCRRRLWCVCHIGRAAARLRCNSPERPPPCGRCTAPWKPRRPQPTSRPARRATRIVQEAPWEQDISEYVAAWDNEHKQCMSTKWEQLLLARGKVWTLVLITFIIYLIINVFFVQQLILSPRTSQRLFH